ncbi:MULTISPECIES: S9 family peptidase [Bacillaceae]|uniref:S9 family peptidase n=1 Tax=Evansella alkalicola TaxID=745819 RepID=A0ABS6JUU1_9BACI|nr:MULTISPECIES: S9 family peptidase [Bacillaceae]MBU9721469.1 S9 family peptidase [Bacillus alkalicola]
MSKRALSVEDFYRFKAPGDVKISSDKTKIVYVVQEVDKENDEFKTNIFMKNIITKATYQLTYSGKDSEPSFSPDGKKIAFVSSRGNKSQIWILPLDGGEAWCLKTNEAVAAPLLWTPDGEKIIYSATIFPHDEVVWSPYPGAPKSDAKRLKKLADQLHEEAKPNDEDNKKENQVKVITRFGYRFDGQGYFGQNRTHIFITPVKGAPQQHQKSVGQQVTFGDFDHAGPALSPDGNFLLVSSRRTKEADHEQKVDIWIFDMITKKHYLLYVSKGPSSMPIWSPCGNFIAFTGHDNREGASTTTDLWILKVDSFIETIKTYGEAKPLTTEDAKNATRKLDRPIGGTGTDIGYKGGKIVCWDGQNIFFLITDRGAGHLYSINVHDFHVKPVIQDENQSISGFDVRDGCIAYTLSSPERPQELFIYEKNRNLQLTTVNDNLIGELQLASWKKHQYTSNDGVKLDGWLMYPPKYDRKKKHPLVLLIHGGPHASFGPTFMFLSQLFAANGYLVFYSNPRGSETYGQEFASYIDTNWGDQDYHDIMEGVDSVIKEEAIDETNMFVHGWSYGGYMSSWIATQTDRFKAICTGASVTNMVSGYGTSDITLADEYEYGGTPWKGHTHLMKHSPINYVETVKTPVMLMHGENDLRVSPSQTEEFYIALKRLGKEAVMIRYPDEYHSLSRPIHQVDRFTRLVTWFNYYRDMRKHT